MNSESDTNQIPTLSVFGGNKHFVKVSYYLVEAN